MPRFFFHVHDGRYGHDKEGTELGDIEEARQEAVRLAGAVLSDEAYRSIARNWHMEVIDDRGLICFRIEFNVIEAEATGAFSKVEDDEPPAPKR